MPEFLVNYRITGRATGTIKADSLEEAKAKINAEIEKEDFDIDLDDLDDVYVDLTELHPVTRNGRRITTTYVLSTDFKGHATHMVLRNSGGAYFVKEFDFFVQQGGRDSDWGKGWRPVIAQSIEEARVLAKSMDWSAA